MMMVLLEFGSDGITTSHYSVSLQFRLCRGPDLHEAL